ncbi:hypothetical protein [Pedobacter sp. N23S346]|uniref:hypothetical protein n=1 Tax=Pedobacter sp. N23S346 TaxID=3402750 RepID=UPI003AC23896
MLFNKMASWLGKFSNQLLVLLIIFAILSSIFPAVNWIENGYFLMLGAFVVLPPNDKATKEPITSDDKDGFNKKH